MTYAVVAPEHPLVDIAHHPRPPSEVEELRGRAAASHRVERMSESGAAEPGQAGRLHGSSVINPFTGGRCRSMWPTTC